MIHSSGRIEGFKIHVPEYFKCPDSADLLLFACSACTIEV